MKKNIKIKVSKRFFLYGQLDGSLKNPLIIILHGLPGNMDEDLYISASRWFNKHRYSTFRCNLYGFQKDARQLMDCTLSIHGSDLDHTVRYFRKKGVKRIFVIGHSFGGPTIFSSKDQDFEGVSLWDPSYKISFTNSAYGFPKARHLKEVNGYLMRWGLNLIIGDSMVKEMDNFSWNSVAGSFKAPIQIILAGNGALKAARKYFDVAQVKKELVFIKGATHYFNDSDNLQQRVFENSLKWFKKQKK
jgi:dienelactone hydrolase